LKPFYDVIVVGGGPVGSTAARVAAQNGVSVLLVEGEHPSSKKVKCAGLISLRALEVSGLKNQDFVIKKRIKGAFINTPSGRRIELDGGDVKAVVIDRRKFDEALLREAEEAGIEVRLGCRAVALEGNRLVLKDNGGEEAVSAKVIVGADGPRSSVAKWAGLPSPKKMLTALQVIVKHEPEREDYVEVYLGRDIAPNFFAWCVPDTNGMARVGLATDSPKSIKSLLEKLLNNRFSNKCKEMVSGIIPIGVSPKTYTDNVLIAGDAAGQVKPTSGGGIYTGITCGRIAGEVASKCIISGEISSKTLSEYERRWRSLLYRELIFGFQVHQLLTRLNDRDIDRILGVFDSPEILRLFTEYGDIDYPSRLARELFKRPSLWAKLLSIIPAREILISLFRLIFG